MKKDTSKTIKTILIIVAVVAVAASVAFLLVTYKDEIKECIEKIKTKLTAGKESDAEPVEIAE